MDPPESLEQIFRRVEEESQRRAQADDAMLSVPEDEGKAAEGKAAEITKPATIDLQRLTDRTRRRGSVSITRFGQLADALSSKDSAATSPPNSPTTIITTLASQSSFYQSQLLNTSHDSIGSHASENENVHAEDDDHVTQVHRIAPRQTLTRTVRFPPSPSSVSRAFSAVSVQAATATTVEESSAAESQLPIATVTAGTLGPSLNSKPSKSSLRSVSSGNWVSSSNWVSKAKDFTKKLRRKSVQPLTQHAT
ncbi:hypothetical protein BT96DRAFT_978350 [Gymnopus androsaceus JB14]|uniref:Uncharacterized protein n=1 Tax=Gymnopus androsaceus JB14 TaxID=1447944 RepID=A0A6A4H9R0_9AGAR|nr:hypothetical protein BT96DRAFT_978350 [Gymnopus androsaceus JB14]